MMALGPGHPARPHRLDLKEAAQRSSRTTSGLLAFSFTRGARLSAAPFASLIANESARPLVRAGPVARSYLRPAASTVAVGSASRQVRSALGP